MVAAKTAMDSAYDCGHVVEIEQEPRHHLVIENEFVRAFAVEIAPHDRTLCHRHPQDYLLYVASGAEIVSAAQGEEPKRLNYSDGECELSAAGLVHVVENLSDKPFRNIVVELSPRARELRCGASPRLIVAEGNEVQLLKETRITRLFDAARAAIFSVEIEPGAELEIAGPAIVSAPYGNALDPNAVAHVEVKQNPVSDLGWISPGQVGSVWCCWKDAGKAVVFQLGRPTDGEGVAMLKERWAEGG